MAELALTISGMTCGSCVNRVSDAIRSVPGVRAVTVSLRDAAAHVRYDPALAGVEQVASAVAGAGYEATPATPRTDLNLARSPESRVEASLRGPIVVGVIGGLALLGVYLGIISIAETPAHALQQLRQDAWFVAAVALGFGIQAGLFIQLRANMRQRASAALPAGSGGVSTAAMVACCAHHLADVLPLLGLSAAAVFLNQYRGWFMAAGLAMNALGIAVMVYTVRKVASGACAPASPSPVV